MQFFIAIAMLCNVPADAYYHVQLKRQKECLRYYVGCMDKHKPHMRQDQALRKCLLDTKVK